MTLPVSGEQHDRAIDAATVRAVADRYGKGLATNPLTTEDRDAMHAAIAAYFASLAEQGVVLVDAKEVVQFAMSLYAAGGEGHRACLDIMRRFASGDAAKEG